MGPRNKILVSVNNMSMEFSLFFFSDLNEKKIRKYNGIVYASLSCSISVLGKQWKSHPYLLGTTFKSQQRLFAQKFEGTLWGVKDLMVELLLGSIQLFSRLGTWCLFCFYFPSDVWHTEHIYALGLKMICQGWWAWVSGWQPGGPD